MAVDIERDGDRRSMKMYCNECGKEIADNSEFCGHCGAALGAAAAQAGQPPAPPGPQAYVPPSPPAGAVPPAPPGPPVQAGPYAPSPRKSPLPWILGGIGVLAVIAIVLVLVFVVFGGDDKTTTSGDNGGASNPEQVVETFYRAMEKQDVDMLLGTIEPSFRAELEEALGDDLERFFEDYFFMAFPEDLKVDIEKMETEIDGDTAVVTVVEGTMTYTDEYGDKVTDEASEDEVEPTQLVKVDGKWYLSGEYLRDSGVDPDELKDLDLDGSEDGDTSGEDGTSTDTTIGDDIAVEVILPIDSKEEAFSALLEDPYVAQWYAESFYPFYSVEEQDDRYVLFLFEQPYAGEQTPYGWFGVDKETGETYEITNE